MYKKCVSLLASVVFLAQLTGCVAGLEDDMRRMQRSLSDLRGVQAEQMTKISALEEEMRGANGRLEELNYSQDKKLGGAITSLQDSLSQIKRRVPPPSIVPQDLLDADQLAANNMPENVGISFTQALTSLREGNFERAQSYLSEVLDIANGGDVEAKALFWRAISFEGSENHKRALEDYIKLSSGFPRSTRAPLAMLRQSTLFVRIGDKQAAKLTLNKLVADYPKSDEVVEAKRRLKDL